MSKVLAAIDNSAASLPVLEMALAFARVLGAEAEAVHVTEDGDRTARGMAERAGVPLRVIAGDAFERLAQEAAADDVVAIVLGMRRRASGGRAGHLVPALARSTEKPILAVPPEARPPRALQRVLVAMEGTTEKARRAKRVLEVAAAAGLEIVVVHVDDEGSIPSFSDQLQYEAEAYANEFLARYAPGAPGAKAQLRIGVPAEEILAAVDAVAPEVVVVGWPQTEDPDRGAVVRQLVDRSHVPVLLVPLA